MLSVIDPTGRRVFRQAIGFALLLIPVSLALAWIGVAGDLYLFGAVFAGAGLLAATVLLWNQQTRIAARRVLLASIIYLPALLALLVLDASLAGR
jgi:protoheme IX farnesyltransferase